jgi:hypothetical protein
VWVEAGEDAPQCVAVDRAREAERCAAGADPRAARFGAAGVVLLDAVADAVDRVHAHLALLEVVPGLAGRQLANRKHCMGTAAESGPRAKFRSVAAWTARPAHPRCSVCVCSLLLGLSEGGSSSRPEPLGALQLLNQWCLSIWIARVKYLLFAPST